MSSQRFDESRDLPATRPEGGLPGAPPEGLRAWAQELVARSRQEGVNLTGDGGLLTQMVQEVLQAGLDVELTEHLGYGPYDPAGRGSGNSRNGSYPKTVTTDVGPVELQMPRDRDGSFDPATVPKHTRRLEGLGANVISLYAKGDRTPFIGPPVVRAGGWLVTSW